MHSRSRSAWPSVAGVLLDEVHDDVARLDVVAVHVDQRVEVEAGVDLAGVGDLGAPGAPRVGDRLVIGRGAVEVEVGVGVGAVEARQVGVGPR